MQKEQEILIKSLEEYNKTMEKLKNVLINAVDKITDTQEKILDNLRK